MKLRGRGNAVGDSGDQTGNQVGNRARLGIGEGAQTGDITAADTIGGSKTSAGRDIYHGLSGEQMQALMQQQTEFSLTLVSAYERMYKDITQEIRSLRKEQEQQSRELRKEQEDLQTGLQIEIGIYREGERNAREARQKAIDERDRNVNNRLTWLLFAVILLVLFDFALVLMLR